MVSFKESIYSHIDRGEFLWWPVPVHWFLVFYFVLLCWIWGGGGKSNSGNAFLR